MTDTLSSVRDQVETRLQDPSNLIFSTDTIDEALSAALAELSNAYGSSQTLKDLDGAASTTFEDADLNTLIVGAIAYCLRFRFIGKVEEASPDREKPLDLAKYATETMHEFQSLLTHVRTRRFYEAVDHPYSQWEWDEGSDFS
ncbi:MAG: hypothetical protein U9R53_05180 [Chloroflexota bacterium]|nr:hypothetical protein [Chloroflexota bacterium]